MTIMVVMIRVMMVCIMVIHIMLVALPCMFVAVSIETVTFIYNRVITPVMMVFFPTMKE